MCPQNKDIALKKTTGRLKITQINIIENTVIEIEVLIYVLIAEQIMLKRRLLNWMTALRKSSKMSHCEVETENI